MPTNDYLPVANGVAANVVTQVAYEALFDPGGDLEFGYQAGTAKSNQFNKTIRQTSMVASCLAQACSDALGEDFLDDGDTANLTDLLTRAIQALGLQGAWSTGDVKLTMKTVADTSWIMVADQTIGSAASAATYANALAEDLFLLLWNNVSNTYAPVSTGRGANAAADWAANKTIQLTRMLGRALALAGGGSGLTVRSLGQYLGEETHAMTLTENGPHTHTATTGTESATHTHAYSGTTSGQSVTHYHNVQVYAENDPIGNGPYVYGASDGIVQFGPQSTDNASSDHTHTYSGTSGSESATHTHSLTTASSGSGTPHNIMQPTGFLNAMIKL